jgi:hypothetical protein
MWFMNASDSHVDDRLTHVRLRAIATALAKVRSDALEGHEPGRGDDSWVFGSRCYRRSCYALTELSAKPENRGWLSVYAERNAFTIFVEPIPMKFFASEDTELSDRNLRKVRMMPVGNPNQGNLYQGYLDADTSAEWCWLIRVERHADGTASRVVFFQANAAGETRNPFYVTMGADVPTASSLADLRREAIDLPPPSVGPREEAEVHLENSRSE